MSNPCDCMNLIIHQWSIIYPCSPSLFFPNYIVFLLLYCRAYGWTLARISSFAFLDPMELEKLLPLIVWLGLRQLLQEMVRVFLFRGISSSDMWAPNSDMEYILTALIYGYSIRSSTGMSNIRRMIGVCPQVFLSESCHFRVIYS